MVFLILVRDVINYLQKYNLINALKNMQIIIIFLPK